MLKVKSNKKLFNDWKDVSLDVGEIKNIVQNDIDITEQDVNEWHKKIDDMLKRIIKLRKITIIYIKDCNNIKS